MKSAGIGYFPLTDDERKCAYCTYRSFCDRGGKAGTTSEAEAELSAAKTEFNLTFEQIAEIEF